MKKLFPIVMAALCGAGAAIGALGDVVASWPSPGSMPAAVARSNGRMYVFCNTAGGTIYSMTTSTGSVYGSYRAAAGTNCRGLAYSWGGHLWQGRAYSPPYYVYDTASKNGSIYRSYAHPSACYGVAPLATGDGGAGTTALFTSNYLQKRIYQLSLAGSVQRSFAAPYNMHDIAYDWRSKVIWGGMDRRPVYGVTTTGSFVTSFNAPANNPYGIAYHDQYLYVVNLSSPYRIWKVHCPVIPNVGTSPSSMGKIKATYK